MRTRGNMTDKLKSLTEDYAKLINKNRILRREFDRLKQINIELKGILGIDLPSFLDAKNLREFINQDVMEGIKEISYLSK